MYYIFMFVYYLCTIYSCYLLKKSKV